MRKQKLKLEKYTTGNTDMAIGFRVRMEPGNYAELSAYAKQHSVTVGDVITSALRQCGVLTAPRTARNRTKFLCMVQRINKKGKTMLEYKKYIRCHIVKATPMTRGDYNKYRGWAIPANENPADEGYHIIYPDGYESWCPKAQFEAAGRPVDGMTFGQAIEAMKQGKKVARRGWNGKGMWLCVPLCDGPKEIPADGIWGKPNAEYAEQNGGTVKVVPYVTMKAADGTIVMGWLASQTDMLSEDWTIVE